MKVKRWSRPAYAAFSILFIAIMCFTLLPSPVQIGPLSFGGAGVASAATTETFTTAGTFYWICPAGVTSVQVEVWGAGSAGVSGWWLGAPFNVWVNGVGGAGGAYSLGNLTVTPGGNYTYVVGAGGVASAGAGGDSYFANSTAVMAKGGGAPAGKCNAGSKATGGAAASGYPTSGGTRYSGGDSYDAVCNSNPPSAGGGGGSSAGTASNGTNSSSQSGATAPTGGGNGGNGGNYGAVGVAGTAPGGGGGGGGAGGSYAGGAGAAGKVKLTYTTPDPPTITTLAATSITATTATLNGNVTSLSIYGNVTQYGFVLSTTTQTNPGNVSPTLQTKYLIGNWTWTGVQYAAGTAFNSNGNVTGLSKGTYYYFRAAGYSTYGWTYGDELSFSTLATPITGYFYNKQLLFNTSATGANVTSAQSDFPIAVHINSSSWSNATENANFFCAANILGKRVQFYDSDTTTNLDYEVELYSATGNTSTNEAIYWVQVPSVAGNSTTDSIWVGYGNDPNGTDQDNPTGVWNSDFKSVSHTKIPFNDYFASNILAYTAYGEPTALDAGTQIDLWYTRDANQIYYAYTLDGQAWQASTATDITAGYKRGSVWKLGNTYFFTATGNDTAVHLFLGTNKINFTDQGLILSLGGGGAWDSLHIGNIFLWPELGDSLANLNEAITDPAATSIVTTDGTKFVAGAYIQIDTEIIKVGAVSVNTLTGCTRGALGTTATTHSNATDIYIYHWKLLYEACNASYSWQIGLATSDNPADFSAGKYGSNPVLTEAGGGCGNPELARTASGLIKKTSNSAYVMYYHTSGTVYRAYSTDLHSWTKEGLTAGIVADLVTDGDQCLVEFQGHTYLLYSPSNQVDTGYINASEDYRSYQQVIDAVPLAPVWDSTSNANKPNTATLLSLPSNVTGQIDGAVSFNGSIQRLQVPDSSSLTLGGNFTISLWLKPTSLPLTSHYMSLICKEDIGANAGGYDLYLGCDGGDVQGIGANTMSTGGVQGGGGINYTLSTGIWQHLAVTYDGAHVSFYINGVYVNQVADTVNAGDNTKLLNIADFGYLTGTGELARYYHGAMDEIRLSATNRSADWHKLEHYSMKKTNFNGDNGVSAPFLSWGVAITNYPNISNTPSSHDFLVVQPSQTIYSKTGLTPPGFPLAAGNCTGNVTNLSSFTLDYLTVMITDFSGGTAINIVSTAPGANEARLMLFVGNTTDREGAGNDTDGIYLTNAAQNWVADVAASEEVYWELKLETGNRNTFAYGVYTATLTFTTDPAGDTEDVIITFTWGDRRRCSIGIAPAFFY